MVNHDFPIIPRYYGISLLEDWYNDMFCPTKKENFTYSYIKCLQDVEPKGHHNRFSVHLPIHRDLVPFQIQTDQCHV